jgi:hypothetical protein
MALGPLEFYRRMWKQHGDVFRVNLGARNAVIVVPPTGSSTCSARAERTT